MDWTAVGAVGELIGALAVVVTLAYLASQIRQNTKVARSSMRHEITNSAMIGGRVLAENDDVARLLQQLNEGEDLQAYERFRLQAFAYMTTRNWENIHYQYLSDMLTDSEWQAFRANLKGLFQGSLWQDYWERERGIYTQAFAAEIAAILAEIHAGDKVAVDSALLGRSLKDPGAQSRTT